jgi:hypothetical protein
VEVWEGIGGGDSAGVGLAPHGEGSEDALAVVDGPGADHALAC